MFSKGFHDFYCLASVAQNVLKETSVQIPPLFKLYEMCVKLPKFSGFANADWSKSEKGEGL